MARPPRFVWIVLTMGDRHPELRKALDSLDPADCVVVANGAPLEADSVSPASVVRAEGNLGVPGGRDLGVRTTDAEIVGFLDDDAELRGDARRLVEAFETDDRLGAVALRLVDERGQTARRHIPRAGSATPDTNGEVAYFLGGACAIRRSAYDEVGGYFTDLFYGHEEIELGWRLIDAGWRIRYLDDVEVFHPRTEISRHADGWRLTGRNRVWIARRTLPWPVALAHVSVWLLLGLVRAPGGHCRTSYLRGWWSGWRQPVDRRPISWATVWKLCRLGRPPIV